MFRRVTIFNHMRTEFAPAWSHFWVSLSRSASGGKFVLVNKEKPHHRRCVALANEGTKRRAMTIRVLAAMSSLCMAFAWSTKERIFLSMIRPTRTTSMFSRSLHLSAAMANNPYMTAQTLRKVPEGIHRIVLMRHGECLVGQPT